MWHRVVTYLQFHIHICFYAVNVNNDRSVIGCSQKYAASCGFLETTWLSCFKVFCT